MHRTCPLLGVKRTSDGEIATSVVAYKYAASRSKHFDCCFQKPVEDLTATPISILWRVIAAIGPRLGPAFVERNLAIVDTLLVFPFLTEPLLACEFLQPHSMA